jgi:CheY-like chemotaxis protein/anti-sigma regulatory factor (Ser/Thr protein kinase)
MVRLIDDLLDVSRINRGAIELRPELLDLSSVALDALETSRPLIQACAHRVEVRTPADPVLVHGDATRLAQAVSNLLNNAAKYTPRGGHIDLAVARDGRDAVVTVTDDGVGIPSPMLSQIFDLFVQVDPSLEKVQGGLGIGLTIVRRLVEMHGGHVEARSAGPGAGSQFVVRLAAAAGAALPARRDAGNGALARTRRILVVDDNRDSALALAMMLRMMGHEAHTAHDGHQALEMAAVVRPHTVLLDLGMPGLSGYDTCRRMREQPWAKGVVIVALTGWGQEDERRRSREAGFDEHLVKPVDLTALTKLFTAG